MAKSVTRRMAKLALRKYVGEMAEEWGLPCEVRFRNASWGSWARSRESGNVISFGMRGAIMETWAGYTEPYQRARCLVKGNRKGKRSLMYLACHEFAHIVIDNTRLHYIPPHGREWRDAFEMLLEMNLPGYDRSLNGKA